MSPEEAWADAIRSIARLTVDARQQTNRMGVLPAGAGERYLCDVEHVLSTLVMLGAVPPAPGEWIALDPADPAGVIMRAIGGP